MAKIEQRVCPGGRTFDFKAKMGAGYGEALLVLEKNTRFFGKITEKAKLIGLQPGFS